MQQETNKKKIHLKTGRLLLKKTFGRMLFLDNVVAQAEAGAGKGAVAMQREALRG